MKCSANRVIARGHHGQRSKRNACIAGAATERRPTEPANFCPTKRAEPTLRSKETCTDM
nr:MAG TPA: hypothetical protein [Caudoviricetes sp.]